jgi:hypothetical protein
MSSAIPLLSLCVCVACHRVTFTSFGVLCNKGIEWSFRTVVYAFSVASSIILISRKLQYVQTDTENLRVTLMPSSLSSSICHGVGPLVDPFRSHASRSLFKSLIDSFCQLGEQCFITLGNLLRGILFTRRIQFLLYSSNLSKVCVIFKSFAICVLTCICLSATFSCDLGKVAQLM